MHKQVYWLVGVLLVLVLALGGCGHSDQAAQQPAAAPLAPLPPSADGNTATPLIVRPSPDPLLQAATITAAYIQTYVAANRQTAEAEITATAAWAQTPEPTLLPPANALHLRDLWPASPQQVAAPVFLYLRSPSFSEWKPDLFWEVHLPDSQARRLPVVEQYSVGDTAQVSPDGRFLGYVTGSPPTLHVLDLASDIDTGIAVPVGNGRDRCHHSIAWSPDGRTLAARAPSGQHPSWTSQLLLFDLSTSSTPQPLLQLPGLLELLGWLDQERLLIIHWSYKLAEPARLLAIDRQGNQTIIHEIEPGIPRCSNLSPDGHDLIYEQDERSLHLELASGQQQPFWARPDTLFWVGGGRTLLISPFNQDRSVWVRPFDQPSQQRRLLLSPPYQSAYRFGISGVSPDGSLLVACEQPSSTNPRIRSTAARTWLYNIAQDRWTHLRDSATSGCDVVVGWSSTEVTQ